MIKVPFKIRRCYFINVQQIEVGNSLIDICSVCYIKLEEFALVL